MHLQNAQRNASFSLDSQDDTLVHAVRTHARDLAVSDGCRPGVLPTQAGALKDSVDRCLYKVFSYTSTRMKVEFFFLAG